MSEAIDVEAIITEETFDTETMEIMPLVQHALVEGNNYQFPILWSLADHLESMLEGKGATEDLVVNDETVQTSKALRAEINKMERTFEENRKAWQREETKKHKDFHGQSKETVLKVLQDHSALVNKKVTEYEELKKQETEDAGRVYWAELSKVVDLQFIPFEKLDVKVGVNTSATQLSKQIDEAIIPYQKDIELIKMQAEPERVMEKYRETLDITESLTQIQEENRIYEELKRKEEAKKEAEQPTPEEVQAVVESTPVHVEIEKEEVTPVIEVQVNLKGNKDKINWLLNIAEENGISVISAEEIKQNRFF